MDVTTMPTTLPTTMPVTITVVTVPAAAEQAHGVWSSVVPWIGPTTITALFAIATYCTVALPTYRVARSQFKLARSQFRIARRQSITAAENFRLAKFDKRYRIYKATQSFIAALVGSVGPMRMDRIREAINVFWIDSEGYQFILPAEPRAFVEELAAHAQKLLQAAAKAEMPRVDHEPEQAAAALKERLEASKDFEATRQLGRKFQERVNLAFEKTLAFRKL